MIKKKSALNDDFEDEIRSEIPQTRLKETVNTVSSSDSSDIESDNESVKVNSWVCKACIKTFHYDHCK